MTDEVKYDPELPYALVRIQGESDRYPLGVIARTRTLEDVMELSNHYQKAYVQVVDTTPKPKIPADAEFIYYRDSGGDDQFGHRGHYRGVEIWWTGAGDYISTEQILECIGDGKVTVLVPKEDS